MVFKQDHGEAIQEVLICIKLSTHSLHWSSVAMYTVYVVKQNFMLYGLLCYKIIVYIVLICIFMLILHRLHN